MDYNVNCGLLHSIPPDRAGEKTFRDALCSSRKRTIIECGSRKELLEQMLYLIAFNGSGLYQPNGLSIPTHRGLSGLVHLDNNLLLVLSSSSLCMQSVVILLFNCFDFFARLTKGIRFVCVFWSWEDFPPRHRNRREEHEMGNGFLINRNCFENHLGDRFFKSGFDSHVDGNADEGQLIPAIEV